MTETEKQIELPDLEVPCRCECRYCCDECENTGYVTTDAGDKVLALMRRHLRKAWDD